jgi:plasmid maintenance system killer protein
MKIGFQNATVRKYCTEKKHASKHLPDSIPPNLLFQRLGELAAFANLGEIPFQVPPLHFHPLRANHAGRFAVTVRGKYRVVFEPSGDFERDAKDGSVIAATVQEINVFCVEDYHE